jgi:hypothetical protein
MTLQDDLHQLREIAAAAAKSASASASPTVFVPAATTAARNADASSSGCSGAITYDSLSTAVGAHSGVIGLGNAAAGAVAAEVFASCLFSSPSCYQ